jgi:hypothetical protein
VFISSTGANAEAYVSEVVYGNINLDGEDGYILTEQQVANERVYIAQEDHNYIPQDLAITEFVNNTIAFNDADYSVAGQPTWNSETTLDYVFASIGSVPFMHPWCFGDWSGNSANVTLCNTMIVLDMTSHDTFCANLANVFALTSPTDLATTASNAVYKGLIVSANVTMGLNRNRLYVTNTTASFIIGQTVKCDGPYTTGIGEVTFANGSANVSGFGTNFTEVLQPGSFIYLGGIAEEFVVKSITNSSFLTLWTKPTSNGSGETWSIVPTGVVRSVTLQAQTNYGKIRRIAFISPGSGYLTPPVVTVDSVSARAQAIYYYDP